MLSARSEGSVYEGDTAEVEETLASYLSEDAASLKHRSAPGAERVEKESETRPSAREASAERPSQASQGSEESSEPGAPLSEYEVLEMREAADADQTIYRVSIEFDESNPMNSVGGIQVFAALKSLGTVLKTKPDFDELYKDEFHPRVDYFLAGTKDAFAVEDAASIADVTISVDVEQVSEGKAGSSVSVPPKSEPGKTDTGGKKESSTRDGAAGVSGSTQTAEPASSKSPKDPTSERQTPASEESVDEQVEEKAAEVKKQVSMSSVLRVDSRRIDNLLNLVSETVINKATFSQISTEFAEGLTRFDEAQDSFRDGLKQLFDSLPGYLESIKDGRSPKEVRKELSDRFGGLYSAFDNFENAMKETVNKFRGSSQNLARITSELQEGVMRIRMVPISQIFSRFPRLVRDLSRSLKKRVELVIEGEDTELDKSVIEDLLDPLIHCVRNSIDHGIESPEQRREDGKPEAGTVTMRASNEGNMILIEISDDGKGIDVESVRRKAIDRGVIHPNKALSDVEAFNLIFDPGFSTAKQITNVSGRGVGLDVVRKQIDRLNGSVSVWSERGMGTRFTIKIPLTLAIIQGLLVRVGNERYAIPITSVLESHRIRPSDVKMIDNYEVFNVRDDVISLLRLSGLFRIQTEEKPEYYYVVVVGSGDKKMGLIVDSLIGEEDVVIKPLRDHYTNAPGIAGANITGDGTVSLIIDVSQLLDLGLAREKEERRRRETRIR
jgi:two-component system chemotaxis sensor kinase CheA